MHHQLSLHSWIAEIWKTILDIGRLGSTVIHLHFELPSFVATRVHRSLHLLFRYIADNPSLNSLFIFLTLVQCYESHRVWLPWWIYHLHQDFGFLDEILLRHCSFTDGLYGYFGLVQQVAKVDHPKLTTANLLHTGELRGINDQFSCWLQGRKSRDRAAECQTKNFCGLNAEAGLQVRLSGSPSNCLSDLWWLIWLVPAAGHVQG